MQVGYKMRTNCHATTVFRWHGEFRNCSEMFKVTKTDDGFCCSFNTVSLSEGFAKPPDLAEDSEEPDSYDYEYGPPGGMDYMYYGNYDEPGAAPDGNDTSDTSDGVQVENESDGDGSETSKEYSESWFVYSAF